MALAAACSRGAPPPAPRAEFLVANADSTFWVTSDARGVRMRGAPLVLTRDAGRFHELYVADDDRSYYDAVFVGQRLFRRDLMSGDSVELLADGQVAAMAERFQKEHPDEHPLAPDEDGAAHPRTSAMAELHIVSALGRYISYEHLTDIDILGGSSRHAAHGGVIDLRSGNEQRVRDVFGAAEESRVVPAAESAWSSARDSLIAVAGARSDAARSALEHFDFSAGSFSIVALDRVPQVQFVVPGSGGGAGGVTIPLAPAVVAAPAWWKEVRDELPLGGPTLSRWPRERFELVARTDTASGVRAMLALRNGEHEWPVGVVQGPVRRIFWLDSPALSRDARQALRRAFDEASLYGEETRIVLAPRRAGPRVQPVRWSRPEPATRRVGGTARARRVKVNVRTNGSTQ